MLAEADLAGTAGGYAFLAELHGILQAAQGVSVQFRRCLLYTSELDHPEEHADQQDASERRRHRPAQDQQRQRRQGEAQGADCLLYTSRLDPITVLGKQLVIELFDCVDQRFDDIQWLSLIHIS